MAEIILQLVPFIIGSAVVPLQVIMVILLLKSPAQGLLKALAFVIGMTLLRLLQGVLFGLVLGEGSEQAAAAPGGKSSVVSTLLVVLGILLLISAYRKWNKEEDPDDPPPAWLAGLEKTSWQRALAYGALLPLISPKLWVFTLGAISTIREAQPS